jgi:hypothetical protein
LPNSQPVQNGHHPLGQGWRVTDLDEDSGTVIMTAPDGTRECWAMPVQREGEPPYTADVVRGYDGRPLLNPGTRVRLKREEGDPPLEGWVQPYDMEYSSGTFPVKFDDGIWRKMDASYLKVLEEPLPPALRKNKNAPNQRR